MLCVQCTRCLHVCLTALKIRTNKKNVRSGEVSGIDEVKAKNVLPFGQHSHKRTQTRSFLSIKRSEKCENITMASVIQTYLSSLLRDSLEAFQQTRQTSRLNSR